MEEVILSHFDDLRNFQNFYSIFKKGLNYFYFTPVENKLKFFKDVFYIDSKEIILYQSIFIDNYFTGLYIEYYNYMNFKKKEGFYKNKRKNGFWIEWYDNQRVKLMGFYKDEKKIGYWIKFNKFTDEKEVEAFYRDNEKDELYIGYYENGEKESEGFYKNGKKIGLWFSWDFDGYEISEDYTE